MKTISKVLLVALALLVISEFLPGVAVDGVYSAIVSAIVLGLLNLFVRPVLFVLTLPITILTLGLFTFVLNALLIWFVASFIEGFTITGFVPAFLASLIISIVSTLGNKVLS